VSDESRKPSPQQDLAALLSNPDAMRFIAFGARTMGRFVETGRDISRVAMAGLTPPSTPPPTPPPSADHTAPSIPAGTLLVPVEAWNRMLDQLGNLHEAGRELAEARERAGRAEATAEFQAERRQIAEETLAQLQADLDVLRTAAENEPAPAAVPAPSPAPALPTEPVPSAVAATGTPGNEAPTTRTHRVRMRLIRILER